MKKLCISILVFMSINVVTVYAIENPIVLRLNNIDQMNFSNPFESKLPVVEEKIDIPQRRQTPTTAQEIKILPSIIPPSSANTNEDGTPKVTPEAMQEAVTKGVAVAGVVWNSDRPQAIMNGQVVSVGDKFLQFQVADIQKERIVLTVEGQQYFVTP